MLGITLISVAVGLGLAFAYFVAWLRFQSLISHHSGALAPALMAAGFLGRLTVFAAILIVFALFTELNVLAVAIAFVALYTILSAVGMQRALAKAKRDKTNHGTGAQGGVVGG